MKSKLKSKQKGYVETRGRKPFTVTDTHRERTKSLRAAGWRAKEIALLFKIDEDTFLKHFWKEYNESYVEKRELVIAQLEKNAAKGNVSAQKTLLSRYDREMLGGTLNPAPKPITSEPEAPKEKLGKKEELNLAAKTAHKGTAWQDHLTKQ